MNGDRRGMSKLHEAAPVGEGARGVDRLDRRTNPSAETHLSTGQPYRAGPKATETGPERPLKDPLKLVPERCSFRVPYLRR